MTETKHTPETAQIEAALAVILARVRCEAIHGQTHGGRCEYCILWAKRTGVPEHLPRMLGALRETTA